MHAKDSRAGEEGDYVDTHSSHVAVVVGERLLRECRACGGAPRARGVANELSNHALARGSDQHRITKLNDARELDERSKRMSGAFRESYSGVERDAPGMDPGSLR